VTTEKIAIPRYAYIKLDKKLHTKIGIIIRSNIRTNFRTLLLNLKSYNFLVTVEQTKKYTIYLITIAIPNPTTPKL
jgi:hypothetical protein